MAGIQVQWISSSPEVQDVVIIYHGGGAMIDGGYTELGRRLAARGSIAVALVDIRGHGRSLGERGKTPATTTIWSDVDSVIEATRKRFPAARIHLLGHSSGAGMVLNAMTHRNTAREVASLIMLAPELGPFLPGRKQRKDADPFATIRLWPFVLNAMSGGRLCKNIDAVTLRYPQELIGRGYVARYSVAMANALTPSKPVEQLARLTVPTLLILAGSDELLPNELIVSAVDSASNQLISLEISEQSSHLGILLDDPSPMSAWLER